MLLEHTREVLRIIKSQVLGSTGYGSPADEQLLCLLHDEAPNIFFIALRERFCDFCVCNNELRNKQVTGIV